MSREISRTTPQAARPKRALARFLWIVVIFLAFIGLAVATRRIVVLLEPGALSSPRNPAVDLDAHFASERALVLTHILPAMLFMVLGPLQFVRGLRSRYPQIHRWSGRIFVAASAVVGISGLKLAFGKTVGGLDEKAAIILFGSFFLISLAKALWHALRREFTQHREWMIRGYAIGLAVATIRPIMATFFAVALMSGHKPQPAEFFGTAFWIGFTLQAIAAEIWINYTRPPQPAEFRATTPELSQG
ncbi:MAG TPA: DUF2306 domain-containing protein [Candidatus Acidoferrum sp.]|nr:DUF2306 domain-containing protein [Candidatus Acidoferrum sp.]